MVLRNTSICPLPSRSLEHALQCRKACSRYVEIVRKTIEISKERRQGVRNSLRIHCPMVNDVGMHAHPCALREG
jgi:hypothetical protein